MTHPDASALGCLLLSLGSLLLFSPGGTAHPGMLTDLQSDAACLLRRYDCVVRVERLVSLPHPTHRIIHIADIHVVDYDDFVLDVRDEYGDTVTDAEIAPDYEAWQEITREVQANQRVLLRRMIRDHGIERVYCEGLTDAGMPAYEFIVSALSNGKHDLESPALMRLGAAGQLLIVGELKEVLPAEDEELYLAANPLSGGAAVFDGAANDAREAAIVQRLLQGDPLSVIVLGGAHDLSEEVRAVGNCEYVRAFVEGCLE